MDITYVISVGSDVISVCNSYITLGYHVKKHNSQRLLNKTKKLKFSE